MIPYSIYKIVHLTGVLMVFLALGGSTTSCIGGSSKNHPWRKSIAITHGFGLLLSLIGGFGLLARLGVAQESLPGWIIAKLGIWTLFAILVGVISRKPIWAKQIWILIIGLGILAAFLAGYKPF